MATLHEIDFIERFKRIFLVVLSYFYCKYSRSSVIFKLPVIYVGNQVIRSHIYTMFYTNLCDANMLSHGRTGRTFADCAQVVKKNLGGGRSDYEKFLLDSIFPTKLTEFPTKFVPFIFIIGQYCPTVKRILPDWLCFPLRPPPPARYAHVLSYNISTITLYTFTAAFNNCKNVNT
jgi:hypothetical protein